MPPKQRITREMILEKSFAMFCKEGMDVVNARSVAKALNCSTQPIFSYFEGMEDLKNAIDQKARETFREAIQNIGSRSLVDCSCAYVRFAAQQPRIHSHLFLRISADNNAEEYAVEGRKQVFQAEAEACGVSLEQAEIICREVWTVAHGLASLQAAGWLSYDEDYVREIIQKAYNGVRAGLNG